MKLLAERERSKWNAGKASGAVYSSDEQHSSTVTEAYRLFSRSNPLHPDLWPSGLKFESEVRNYVFLVRGFWFCELFVW